MIKVILKTPLKIPPLPTVIGLPSIEDLESCKEGECLYSDNGLKEPMKSEELARVFNTEANSVHVFKKPWYKKWSVWFYVFWWAVCIFGGLFLGIYFGR